MSERAKLTIRGIYSTALTDIFLKRGFAIVSPSALVRQRFALVPVPGEEDVMIRDRADKQGVVVEGDRDKVALVVEALRSALPEAIYRGAPEPGIGIDQFRGRWVSWAELAKLGRASCEVEFPATAKNTLDRIRAKITPTLPGHHLLKVIDSSRVDSVEADLLDCGQAAAEVADSLRSELVYRHYAPGQALLICHVKLDGAVLRLRGRIKGLQPGKGLELERKFRGGGRYDGLGVAKEEGDWGLVGLEEGSWVSRLSYFALGGEAKGETYNINTPAEFYPDCVRYVDLEVDVVRWPDGTVRTIDRESLQRAVAEGMVSSELASRALTIATELECSLRGITEPQG